MNKSAIQKYAIWARNELIDKVTRKAFEYGVTKEEIINPNSDSVNGKLLSSKEKSQREELIKKVKELGFYEAIEEVAYTWFNRFIALRFMEVNGYLPTRIRVFTNENNEFKPEILKEAMNLNFDGLDKELIYSYVQSNKTEDLFKYLLIAQCNDMGKYLPGMFTQIEDYHVLLFPDNLLREDSVLGKLISDIDEDSWLDQVQMIGWLYQFYNTEPKADVYARPKGSKITKNDVPAVTQLFTPDWIVKYMVENSLGRYWIECHPNPDLGNNWRYYLDEAEQEPEVVNVLEGIREQRKEKRIEDIKIIDPCMGSGHILVYVFDVFMQIYESEGWTQRDAAVSILKNNIYGLDIDKRAYQLAYFSLMMKARSYNRRILNLNINPNLFEVTETKDEYKTYFVGSELSNETQEEILEILNEMRDAKEYGSLVTTSTRSYDDIINEISNANFSLFNDVVNENIVPLIKCAKVLSMKFDVTVTNPPYTPLSGCSAKINSFAKEKYPDSKSDFCSVFIERCHGMTEKYGYQAMITMHSWMFLSSFEKLRKKLLINNTIINMAHLGVRAFEEIGGEVVQTTSFIFISNYIKDYISSFKRLVDFKSQDSKEEGYLEAGYLYQTKAINFSKIPGSPIAYWASRAMLSDFTIGVRLDSVACPKQGIKTADKDRFLRAWYEVDLNKMSVFAATNSPKWYPCNKGGSFRKWYGNNEYVVNWENNGYEICNFRDENGKLKSRPQNLQYMLREGITYTNISISSFGARYSPAGYIYDAAGSGIFCNDNQMIPYILAFLTSEVAAAFTKITSPTMSFEVGQIGSLPFIYKQSDMLDDLVLKTINISHEDWDAFETSWDFTLHPLVKNKVNTLDEAYLLWKQECKGRFAQLKSNEEELNRVFIDIYGLNGELRPDVEDGNVTVHCVYDSKDDVPESMRNSNYVLTKKDVIVSFISYAVGCMFGRYSLDVPGLVYAGGEFDWSKYKTFIPDKDNIIPICDDEYFEDDIVGKFVTFVEVVYGSSTLNENLSFIASALGGTGNPREVIRDYFLKNFYKDHCNTYQVTGSGKRPIYWLFDSGKKNGFKALMYIHRYQPDLIARLRTDYVHETQSRLAHSIEMIENQLDGDLTSSERVRLNKELTKFKAQAEEVRTYEEIVHPWADKQEPMDLDDGVKKNYEKFSDLLAKIK